MWRGSPSSTPSARTSSLNSSRSGSTSLRFIRSGKPPTLWWLLIVAEGPWRHRLDDVRIERALRQEPGAAEIRIFFASSSKTSMNSPPMILRFCSGSVTPASLVEEARAGVDDAQIDLEGAAEDRRDLRALAGAKQAVVDEDARQPSRRSPCRTSAAATAESTPPDRPQITRRVGPTCSAMSATASSTNEPSSSRRAPQTPKQEVGQQLGAARRVHDLGMELHALELRRGVANAAAGQLALSPTSAKPGRQRVDAIAVRHPDRQLLAGAKP